MDIKKIQHQQFDPHLAAEAGAHGAEELMGNEVGVDEVDNDLEGDEVSASEEDDKLRKLKKKKGKKQIKNKQSDSRSNIQQMLDGDRDERDVMRDFAKKLANKGMKTHLKMSEQMKQDLQKNIEKQLGEQMVKQSKDNVGLSQEAKSHSKQIAEKFDQQLSQSKMQQQQSTRQDQMRHVTDQRNQPKTAEMAASAAMASGQGDQRSTAKKEQNKAVQKYMNMMVEHTLKGDGNKAQEVRQFRENLLTSGMNPKKLYGLESTAKKFIQKDLKNKLKQNFLKLAMSYKSKDFSISILKDNMLTSELKSIAQKAGVDLRSAEADFKAEARSEMQAVIADELDKSISSVGAAKGEDIAELMKAFDKFSDISNIAKFDAAKYIRTVQGKIDDWGLHDFEDPKKHLGHIDTETRGQQGDGQGKKRQWVEPETALEALEDEIRSIVMQQSVRQDIKSIIELKFKLRRLSKAYTAAGGKEKQLAKIQEEGVGLAKLRLMDMLRESLEEKASLVELKGPPYRLVQKKLKMALKGLKKLGSPVPKHDIMMLRDQINASMFSIIKESYLNVNVQLETMPNDVNLKRQKKQLLATLERLKKESKIKEDINPKGSRRIVFSSDTQIIEAA